MGLAATGEEEANLELTDLIRKGEVAWLHPEDMPKEKEPPRRATYAEEDSEDEPEPASTGRGRKREEEDAWVPGQKRRAALKSRARFRDESGARSSPVARATMGSNSFKTSASTTGHSRPDI